VSSLANPLVAACLGAAAGLYLPGASPLPGFTAVLLRGCAFLAAAVGLTLLGFPPARNGEKPGGEASRRPRGAWVVIAAAGLFSGTAVGRGLELREASRFFGLPPEAVVRVEGRILEDSRPRRGGGRAARLRALRCFDRRGNEAGASTDLPVFFPAGPPLFWGDRVVLEGRLARGRDGKPVFFVSAGEGLRPQRRNRFFAIRAGILLRARERIGGIREDWAALFAALFLGLQDDLDPAVSESFRRAGVVHILALSGMHLGILVVLVRLVLRPFAAGVLGTLLCAGAVGLYTFVAGPRPSLLRAAAMYLLHEGLSRAGRRPETAALLAFSFLASCLLTPEDLHSSSFILSYLAMGGILIFSRRLKRFLYPLIPDPLGSAVAMSLAAQLVTAPYLLAAFGSLQPAAVPASVLLGPLTAAFLWLGVPGFLLAGVSTSAEAAVQGLLFPMQYLYTAIVATADFFSRFPPWGGG